MFYWRLEHLLSHMLSSAPLMRINISHINRKFIKYWNFKTSWCLDPTWSHLAWRIRYQQVGEFKRISLFQVEMGSIWTGWMVWLAAGNNVILPIPELSSLTLNSGRREGWRTWTLVEGRDGYLHQHLFCTAQISLPTLLFLLSYE